MDNEFSDFLGQNWNEKFKAVTAATHLDQLQQSQRELQKPNNGSVNTNHNRLFLDELSTLRYNQHQQQAQQHSQPGRNNLCPVDIKDIKVSYSPPPDLRHQQQQSLRPNATNRTLNPSTSVDIRLSNLVSPTSTLRLPDDTTISRSQLSATRDVTQQHLHQSSTATAAPSTSFSTICTSGMGNQETADSTTPPPSIQSTSSSGTSITSMLVNASGLDHDKKAANSIRGMRLNILYFGTYNLVTTCNSVFLSKI